MSSDIRWTDMQRAAITHASGALLVSAAAGSGKTAVLAARCVHMVCDADSPCDVDQLLVLTFTRAAAGEMRERIDHALRQRIEKSDDSRLHRQRRLIDRASITTLDGFCASLVRANFHLLGIDPAFRILAPEDAALLRAEVVDRLLEGEYDSPRAESLKQLLDSYFGSDDSRLRSQLISANALRQSIVDPERWAERALQRLVGGADGTDDELLSRFGQIQERSLRATIRQFEVARRYATEHEGLDKYVAHLDALNDEIRQWLDLSADGDFNALAARVSGFEAPKLPSVSKDTSGKEEAQALLNRGKDEMKEGGTTHKLCRWSSTQLRSDLARITPHAEYFLSLTALFTDAYDQAKRDMRTLDFADTETLALKVLQSDTHTMVPSTSALDMHERFKHVLVDEFQDINPLQNAILRLISRDIASEQDASVRSNFFTVGDVKQSIYRFRLAEPQQFIDRQAALRAPGSNGRVIDLQENFRSRGPLLEAVNDVFRLLMTAESTGIHYDATHELRSIAPYPDFGPHAFAGKPIELHLLPREIDRDASSETTDDDDVADSFEREIALVAQRITELIGERRVVAVKQNGTLVAREIQYGDIAVLLRSARFKSSIVADELRGQGIPVHADDSTGFFNVTEVQDVLAILRLIANQQQDIPMAAFLRSPLASICEPETALASIRMAHPSEPFHRAVVLYANSQDDALADQIKKVLNTLELWRKQFQGHGIAESLSQLFDDTGYLTFCRALPDGAQRVANLEELQERAAAFDSYERQGLDRFLTFLEDLEADDQLGRPSIAASSQDYVRVMTVHKSKGLEFPVVIIPDLGKKFNEQSLASPVMLDRDLGIGLSAVEMPLRVRYPSLATMVIRDHVRRQAIAEEVRVLYVGLTRAREHLILIGSSKSTYADVQREWSARNGPIPDEAIQRARTALDWIAPIAAITEHKGLGTFLVTDWHDRTLPSSKSTSRSESASSKLQGWFDAARTADRPMSDPSRQAIDRLTFAYPHLAAAREASTRRISDRIAATPSLDARRAVELQWPNAYRPRQAATAVDIGSATHRFLELLDPQRIDTRAGIASQIQDFVARRMMNDEEARLVDVHTIEWFASSDLAALMRRSDTRLFREQSVAYSFRPEGLGESDCALVRGRVDALMDTPPGLILIDYKTDRVAAEQLIARAESYVPQVLGYAQAVSGVTRRKVIQASLVFLHARRIIDLPAALLANYA